MADINTTFSLRSTTISSSALNLTDSDQIDVQNPIQGLSRKTVGTSGDTEIIANSESAKMYVYLKNLDTTNFITVKTTDQADADSFAILHPAELMFFCLPATTGLHLLADTADCIIEYALFTKGTT